MSDEIEARLRDIEERRLRREQERNAVTPPKGGLLPLQLSAEDLACCSRVMMHLYNHPDEDQNVGEVKKIRHFARVWLDPDWRKIKKKEIRDEIIARDRQALDETGIRKGRKRKKEIQDSYQELIKDHKHSRIQLHPFDFKDIIESKTDQMSRGEICEDQEAALQALPNKDLNPAEAQTADSKENADAPPARITTKFSCYVCKKEITYLHRFYDQMCTPCGDFNLLKRNQTCNLMGKVALVTGGRIKIGFEVGLKLLRCGAHVIVTSRFQNDTILRYSRESDFNEWKDRLHAYALDMRLLGDVEAFVRHMNVTYKRLDIIINNAAQTIRRPPIFYRHLLEGEKKAIATDLENLKLGFHPTNHLSITHSPHDKATSALIPQLTSIAATSSASTAELTQIPFIPEDLNTDLSLFPPGEFDADGQQVDNRTENSWVLRLHDVSTVEAAEVHIVNALAPFVINSKLKPLLLKSGEPTFIINVSSMEGKFSRNKKSNHPHTNMAKASMNMMTRTSAPDYAQDQIFMNSVDTGWITYENPCELTALKQELKLEPPIDEIDGAARILDPIFTAVLTQDYKWGVFYKDYFPSKW